MSWKDEIRKGVKIVGFWNNAANDYPQHPMPKPDSMNYDKEKMIQYLSFWRNMKQPPMSLVLNRSRGISSCRICGKENWVEGSTPGTIRQRYPMGSRTLTDGVYAYPEGLKHYIEIHEIELPEDFINHAQEYDFDPIKSFSETHNLNYKRTMGLALSDEFSMIIEGIAGRI